MLTYNTRAPPHVGVGDLVGNIDMKDVILVGLNERSRELVVDQDRLSGVAVWRNAVVRYIKVVENIGSKA